MRLQFSLSFFFLFAGSQAAQAHWGHVGELAGHGHLIGLGAAAGAAALAAWLAAGRKKGEDETGEEAMAPEDVDAEGETA